MNTAHPPRPLEGAPLIYCVKSWMPPETGQAYMDWLESRHMAEFCSFPGALWAHKVALDQPHAETGWPQVLLIYGFESRTALEAYLESPLRDTFWAQLEELKDCHASDRFWGDIDFSI